MTGVADNDPLLPCPIGDESRTTGDKAEALGDSRCSGLLLSDMHDRSRPYNTNQQGQRRTERGADLPRRHVLEGIVEQGPLCLPEVCGSW